MRHSRGYWSQVRIANTIGLEYRGYDSAGVAYILEGSVHRVRSEGKLGKLDLLLDGVRDVPSSVGLGHTRKLPNRKRLQGAADARRRVRRRTPCTSSARQQSRCGAP